MKKLRKEKDFKVKTTAEACEGRGTELTVLHDPEGQMTELTSHEGSVPFDNIDYLALPDGFFTDPGNKGPDTLDMDAVIDSMDDEADLVEVLGAGNAVDVEAGYYATCATGSAPAAPLPGIAPTHSLPGGECPEPATLGLLSLGAVALLKRRR